MNRDRLLRELAAEREQLLRLGVTGLYLFGSRASGRASRDSDIDLFVEHDPSAKFSLFDLVGVKLLIEKRLGIRADVTTRGSLHPMMRSSIETNAVRIF